MATFLFISPVRLYRHDFLAGVILLVALLVLFVDLAIIGMRAYAFNTVQRWSLEDGIAGLDGMAYSLMVAVIWLVTMVFLLVDLVLTLLQPSRDLQEGAVISFGIISIMQVPIVALYLKWELSFANSIWLQHACVATLHSPDCTAWWSRLRLVSITSSTFASFTHLLLVGLCARYVHSRPPTKQSLIMNHRDKRAERDMRAQKRRKAGDRGESEFERLKDRFARRDKRRSGVSRVQDQAHSELRSDGAPLPPVLGRRPSDRKSVASLPPYDTPGAGVDAVHTDSESDVEKQPLAGR
ncbi:hypothetical protein JCM10450v2_001176 [Rhodotorula kratochvilovae]